MPKNGPNAEWSLSEELARSQQPNAKMDSAIDSALTSTQPIDGINTGFQEATVTIIQSDTLPNLNDELHPERPVLAYVQKQYVKEQSQSSSRPDTSAVTDNDVEEALDGSPSSEATPNRDRSTFADQQDEVVIGQLIQRTYEAIPGETISFHFSVLNNGQEIAVFSPYIIGSIPSRWTDISPSHTRLHPGEQTSLEVTIRLPRLTTLRPDTYPLAIVIRAGGSAGRFCQMGVELRVKPFVNLKLGSLEPDRVGLNWRNPGKTLILPLTNQGNEVVDVRLEGHDSANACDFQFSLINSRRGVSQSRMRLAYGLSSEGISSGGDAHFLLHPGQTHYAPIAVRCRNQHLFAIKRSTTTLAVGVYTREHNNSNHQPALAQDNLPSQNKPDQPIGQDSGEIPWTRQGTAIGKATYTPLIGPGTILTITGLAILGILGLTLTLLLIVLSLSPRSRPAQLGQAVSIAAPAPQNQAALEIGVKVNEVVPPSNARLADGNETSSSINSLAQVSEMALASSVDALPTAIVVRPVTAQDQQPQPVAQSSTNGVLFQPNTTQPLVENNDIGTAAASDTQIVLTADGVPIVQPSMITSPGEDYATNSVAQTSPDSRADNRTGSVSSNQATIDIDPVESSMTYEQMFRLVSVNYDLDWRMLAAQAYVESSFNPMAQGKRGDLGLMQILPETWQEWAPRASVQDPFDSYSNVLVAAAYLDYLRDLLTQQGYPEEKWVLTAYNWGPNRVTDFLNGGGSWEALSEQRKKYAIDVIRIANSLPEN